MGSLKVLDVFAPQEDTLEIIARDFYAILSWREMS